MIDLFLYHLEVIQNSEREGIPLLRDVTLSHGPGRQSILKLSSNRERLENTRLFAL